MQMRHVNHGSQLLIVTGTALPSTGNLTTPGITYLGDRDGPRCTRRCVSVSRCLSLQTSGLGRTSRSELRDTLLKNRAHRLDYGTWPGAKVRSPSGRSQLQLPGL